MPLPIVAIVGRTNVGKSVLFNRLARQRLAVVEHTPGVTRDRLYAEVDLADRSVVLVDTGGLAGAESDELITQVKQQAAIALQEADLLIMLVDAQEGLVSLDYEVAEVVRRSGKPYVLVANKTESPKADATVFAELRLGMPVEISALHGQGLGELIEAILEQLPEAEVEPERVEGETAVALVGRPNVGKSAIINALLGEERVIVSEEPGTTRDAIDIEVEMNGEPFRLVDTAGLRRRGKRSQGLEYYSSLRTLRALQRADVGLAIIDAAEGITKQDANIAGEVEAAGRGLVIVVNKWDLVQQLAYGEEEVSAGEIPKIEADLR
ncbi:MAG: ribosome biogenesis GTPase Der, partial [Planctomycetes bacterium]|nr:ribosome biogenesis GTPase Der [Planctomycetota bacterium]